MVVGKPLLTVEQISKRVSELAGMISADYEGKDLLAIGILKGAFVFFSDLVRYIQTPLSIDFLIASSYLNDESTGEVRIHYDIREEIAGKNVLLVEDIVDTGITLNYLRERILRQGPESLRICTFLDKKERRKVDVPLDYVGFEIPDEFVVGYGLDYDNKFRNLPYISAFRKRT
ncbi:MAG: hypoxanthine phosphoribosyltransferase [Thermodesulfovibrio sp.]|nr:hypoxanthine phosphoribosyltransferase [Thermodesulfovibrio sp.]